MNLGTCNTQEGQCREEHGLVCSRHNRVYLAHDHNVYLTPLFSRTPRKEHQGLVHRSQNAVYLVQDRIGFRTSHTLSGLKICSRHRREYLIGLTFGSVNRISVCIAVRWSTFSDT